MAGYPVLLVRREAGPATCRHHQQLPMADILCGRHLVAISGKALHLLQTDLDHFSTKEEKKDFRTNIFSTYGTRIFNED